MSARINLGTPEEWGLTPEKHREICAELDDHLQSLAERAGSEAAALAATAGARLKDPRNRRRLSAAHLADQVYATLHRRPSRQEWRELAWLLFWFALILGSDLFAAFANARINAGVETAHYSLQHDAYTPQSAWAVWLSYAAWLWMALARAGFFASFAHSLHRAWQTGWGVCLGRILQLKLIHTVLVVVALMGIGSVLEKYAWGGYYPNFIPTPLPAWLNAAAICGALALLAALLWLLRPRRWNLALYLLIAAFFLYPGGPAAMQKLTSTTKIIRQVEIMTDGTRIVNYGGINDAAEKGRKRAGWAAPTQAEVEEAARQLEAYYADPRRTKYITAPTLDIPANKAIHLTEDVVPMWMHIGAWEMSTGGWELRASQEWRERYQPLPATPLLGSIAPNAVPGGGVGWLAAPIPLLTCIGLLGLLGLLGRRGPVDFLLYFILAGLALGTTLMPFFVGQPESHLMELSPMAIMHTPFPGFEALMVSPLVYNNLRAGLMTDFAWTSFTLISGLLLSAALPWLMTALFLKPKRGPELPPVQEAA